MSNYFLDDDQHQDDQAPSLKEQREMLETYKLAKELGLLEEDESSPPADQQQGGAQDQGDDDAVELVDTGSIVAAAPSRSATDVELRKRAKAGDSSALAQLMKRSRERAGWQF